MGDNLTVILGRDGELAAMAAAVAAAEAGRGAFVLVEGPAGIGKTTLLRAACGDGGGSGLQILTARGLALERGFPYGIVRQLVEPVRAVAGPGEWHGLLDGAAGLAARVFDWTEAGSVEDDDSYGTTHGLYGLVANLAARRPLVIVVDDAQWADAPSLRWLAHLAARIDGLPVALLLAVRDGPDEPVMLGDLRACPAGTQIRLGPLGRDATAALVRKRLGEQADAKLCQACHASTGGNPFLLESLATALRKPGGDALDRVGSLGPQPVAQAVLRRVAQLGEGAGRLTRALAVLGGPAPLRHAAALAGQDMPHAAQLADRLRAADVLAPGSMLEFAHPIVRAAIYESIPPSERALAHAETALLLERDGADAERLALHLLRSEPGGNGRVTALLRAAVTAASGRGAPGTVRRGDSLLALTGHTSNVESVAFGAGAGGQPLLASAGADGTVRLWDPATGAPVAALHRRPPAHSVAFAGQAVVIGDDEGITLIELDACEPASRRSPAVVPGARPSVM